MSSVEAAEKLKQLPAWLKERPWVRNAVTTLVWVVAAFAVQKNGYNALGIAFLVTAVFITVMLGLIAIADYVSRGQSDTTQRQRARNIAIAVALGAMVLMFYAATIVRMGGNVVNRPLVIPGAGIVGSGLR
ncbi:MAG: hypothetical protein ABL901_00560 [Hyphomicrobiaceae bacterium]